MSALKVVAYGTESSDMPNDVNSGSDSPDMGFSEDVLFRQQSWRSREQRSRGDRTLDPVWLPEHPAASWDPAGTAKRLKSVLHGVPIYVTQEVVGEEWIAEVYDAQGPYLQPVWRWPGPDSQALDNAQGMAVGWDLGRTALIEAARLV